MLYCLSSHPSNRYKYVVVDHDYYEIKRVPCDTCGRTVPKCQLRYWPPRMRLEGGKRYPDILSVSVPFEEKTGIIVTERALNVFQMENISGFEATAIELDGVDTTSSDEVPQYYFLTVTGRVSLDHTAMRYRKKHVCRSCGSYEWSRQRVGESAVDQDCWDGSDLCFLTDFPNKFLCSQKVIDAIKSYNLKGFAMCSESEIFLPLKAVKIC